MFRSAMKTDTNRSATVKIWSELDLGLVQKEHHEHKNVKNLQMNNCSTKYSPNYLSN